VAEGLSAWLGVDVEADHATEISRKIRAAETAAPGSSLPAQGTRAQLEQLADDYAQLIAETGDPPLARDDLLRLALFHRNQSGGRKRTDHEFLSEHAKGIQEQRRKEMGTAAYQRHMRSLKELAEPARLKALLHQYVRRHGEDEDAKLWLYTLESAIRLGADKVQLWIPSLLNDQKLMSRLHVELASLGSRAQKDRAATGLGISFGRYWRRAWQAERRGTAADICTPNARRTDRDFPTRGGTTRREAADRGAPDCTMTKASW
jgi:hypothetical protein